MARFLLLGGVMVLFNSLVFSKEVQPQQKGEFKVLLEAELPQGFPEPGPLGKVILKDYPDCRLAQTERSTFQNIAFMRLFMHIKSNDIAMTTPVIMKLDNESMRREDMAFVYANPQLGKVGKKKGGVSVKDLPSNLYISIGVNGYESKEKVSRAKEKLKQWFVENPNAVINGSTRLLSYNSPMVKGERRFFEVQIPVKMIDQPKTK